VAMPRTEVEDTAAAAAAPGAGDVEMTKEKKDEGAEGAKAGDKAPAKGAEKAGEKKPEAKAATAPAAT